MSNDYKVTANNVNFYYGNFEALHNVSLNFKTNQVTALIGPSGCGKSTFLRCLNRMNDLIAGTRVEGEILLDGDNIYAPSVDVVNLRGKVGMVFQKPNPFPKTIYENIAYGLRVNGVRDKAFISERVERSLKHAALWEEVKDRLQDSALDPIATQKIEELIHALKENYTIIIVTHNMQQAARVSDVTAFFYIGKLIEVGVTDNIFTRPRLKETEDYITGRFG